MAEIYDGSLWRIDNWVSGYSNNSYLITCRSTNQSVIVDTPDNPVEMMAAASETDVQGILITHNHWDHLEGFDDVTERFEAPVGIGSDDEHEIAERAGHRSSIDVTDDAMLQFGNIQIRCISTPGHTPGSTCYLLPAESPSSQPHVFTGDTLFPGGPGRTGSVEAFDSIERSITSKLHTLPANAVVLPGHGDSTTIGDSIDEYRDFASSTRPADLFGEVTWK